MQNTPLKFVQSKAALENSPYPNLFRIRYLSKILSVLNAIHPFFSSSSLSLHRRIINIPNWAKITVPSNKTIVMNAKHSFQVYAV